MNVIIDLKRVQNIGAIPITLAEAKTQLRVDFSDDDTEITALISKAIRYIEGYCNISIIYQRVQLIALFDECMKLPYGPVIGIESVSSPNGTPGSAPVAYETYSGEWGSEGDMLTADGRLKVVYTAGNFLPDDLKDVVLELITFLYENRGKAPAQDEILPILRKAEYYKVCSWF